MLDMTLSNEEIINMRKGIISMLLDSKSVEDIMTVYNCDKMYVNSIRHRIQQCNGDMQKINKLMNSSRTGSRSLAYSNIDKGKVLALYNAGWSVDKIAGTEFYCKPEVIVKVLKESRVL